MSCELWSVGAAAGAPLMLPIERIEAIEGVEGIDSLDSIDSIDSLEAAQAAGLSSGAVAPHPGRSTGFSRKPKRAFRPDGTRL